MSFFALRNKKTTRRTISLLAAILFTAAASFTAPHARAQVKAPKPPPDLIVFANGDQLTGTLERGIGSSIVFKSDVAGENTISLDKVRLLRARGSFAVLG